jgi:hypothetical protein
MTTKATNQDEDDILPPDELQRYIRGGPTTVSKNDTYWSPIAWWIDESSKGTYDSLHLYALGQLSCAAMATECERVFSAAKQTLSPERNALGPKMIEACECLRWWWRTGVIGGKPPASAMIPRVEAEARVLTALLRNALLGDGDE